MKYSLIIEYLLRKYFNAYQLLMGLWLSKIFRLNRDVRMVMGMFLVALVHFT